jgi:ATP-binding cassette subfamily B protein
MRRKRPMSEEQAAQRRARRAARSSAVLLGWLWRNYLSKHLWPLLAALFFMTLEGAVLGALSWIMQPMFDQIFMAGDRGALWWVGATIMGIFTLRAVATVAQRVLLSVIAQRTAADLRRGLLSHLMQLDGSFHQTHPPGYLIQRLQNDVMAVNQVWNALITGAGRDIISLVILMGVALSIDWMWTLVACVGIPLMILPTFVLQKFVRRRAREARDLGAQLATRLDEVFHGIVPVKLNRLEGYQSRRFSDLTDHLVRAEVRAKLGSAALPGMIDLMSGLGFLGVLVFGGSQIIDGTKTVGEFMSFFTAIGLAFNPLRRLGAVSGVWQTAAAAIERIKDLFETRPTLTSPSHPRAAPDGTPGVRLTDVALSYGDTRVLDGTTLTAPAGRTTALVGPSGAGKSTVFNLLTRLVDPQSGTVEIGGTPVSEMSLTDLRGLFSVVSQDALLFDDSLRENILLGRTDVTDAQLQTVLDAAHVSDFVPALSDGLDTQVGPRGSNLSGGQRQRVAIARALLRDTPILLLDEATSALDAESEQVVQAALDRLAAGRTTLVIAHRLSTVRGADKIVVMDKGRVIDEGTHDQLIARDGTYARLYRMQFKADGPTADSRALDRLGRHRKDTAQASTDYDDPAETSLLQRIARRLFGP